MKLCPKCQTTHDKSGIFCSRKCANSRQWTEADCLKKSVAAKDSQKVKTATNKLRISNRGPKPYCQIRIKVCKECKSIFIAASNKGNSNHITCSRLCRDNITSRNGTLKRRLHYNEMTFQSKWEIQIAQFLDEMEIDWIQPRTRIKFFLNEKERSYLPDFYLSKYHIFLDVKNPFKQKQDAEKLNAISKVIPLLVGDVHFIKKEMELLHGFKPRLPVSKTGVIFLSP